jgi:anti-sigma regulatory factor (Ser/Thr protein kinase)
MTACTLPGALASAAAARSFVRQILEDEGLPEFTDDAELCASELVANAVGHTWSGLPGGTLALQVTVTIGGVRIEVRDAGAPDGAAPAVPAQRPPLDAERGRGLWLIEALSARCEFGPGIAWCELGLEASARAVTGRAAA